MAQPLGLGSNRGPVSYTVGEDGELTAKRGGGGLVSGLSAIGDEADALWVCAALNEGDREAVRRGPVANFGAIDHERDDARDDQPMDRVDTEHL